MGTIKERTDKNGKIRYQVIIRMKGYPTQTATFRNKTLAKRWEQQTEAAIIEGRHFKTSEAKKHTLKQMIDRYLSQRQVSRCKQNHLTYWKHELGAYLLSDITPSMIAEKRDELLSSNTPRGTLRSPATVNRYIAALSHAYSIAFKEYGWVESSPVRYITKPKEPPGRVRFLNADERNQLLSACQKSKNPFLYCVVVLAMSTGMRQGEIMNLTWKDLDLFKKQIILEKTKNGTRRSVPIVGLAFELLTKLSVNRKVASELLFPGKLLQTPMDLRKAWLAALKQAKIQNFRFHDLRHCAASYLAMSGATLTEIALILGHKHIEVTRRYSHLSEQHVFGVVERMNESIFG